MKKFTSTLFLVLGLAIIHTHGAPNLLGHVLKTPQGYQLESPLDLDSLDLDSLGDYDKLQNKLNYVHSSLPIEHRPSSYDFADTPNYNKKADLADLLSYQQYVHKLANDQVIPGGIKDLYSSTSGTLGQAAGGYYPSGVFETIPVTPIQKEYLNSQTQHFNLPSGQQLQCVVA